MKKTGMILLLFLSLILFMGCGKKEEKKKHEEVISDEIKFQKEYEKLNKYVDDNGDKVYPTVVLTDDNKMKYASFSDVKKIIKNGTGVIYFGYPECPWCRHMVPVLIDAAKESDIDTIYYLDNHKERDEKILDKSGQVATKNKGSKEYQELITLLYSELGPYQGLNNDTIKRLYYPMVVFVKDGKIVGSHVGTVLSQTDPKETLTKEQQKELKEIFMHYMSFLTDACGEDC